MRDVPLLAFGALVIKSTAMLPATVFFGAKVATGDNVVHYNLPDVQQSAVENFLKVNQYPTYRLIDRNGNLLDVNSDPRDLDALENLLKAL